MMKLPKTNIYRPDRLREHEYMLGFEVEMKRKKKEHTADLPSPWKTSADTENFSVGEASR